MDQNQRHYRLDELTENDLLSKVPLIDVQRQYAALHDELEEAIVRVSRSGNYVLGPECRELEEKLASYTRANHALACASGSDALLLALMACGVRAGDEVIVPSFTFFATGGAVARMGALPVFADIDPATFNIDPRQIPALITPATKAVIPVHLYGQCAEMDAVMKIAREKKIAVIEDAAQAIGAEYHGQPAGTMGDIGCFSFYPTKNLGCMGDGGALSTMSENYAGLLKILRVHGEITRYHHRYVGINSRLDTLQGAVLCVKFPHLESWISGRTAVAARYHELFAQSGLDKILTLPRAVADCRHVWNQYVIRVPEGGRDALRAYLTEHGIGTQIYYPLPLHLQECFENVYYRQGSLPHTERAAQEVLALPIFPELTPQEQATVVARIRGFYQGSGKTSRAAMKQPAFLKKSDARQTHDS